MKVILTDQGDIIGLGEDEKLAREDAVDTLFGDVDFLKDAVSDLMCRDVTPALAAIIKTIGSPERYKVLPGGVIDVWIDEDNSNPPAA
jgi:hypothetical protein